MLPALARGDVVLTRFPFTDLTGASLRPALVVSQGQIGEDFVLIAISSVVRGSLAPADYTLDSSHPEFATTGLRVRSVLRMHKLAAVERFVITRRLGRIGPRIQAEVDQRLRVVLGL
jgi:mRNA interferase MazF